MFILGPLLVAVAADHSSIDRITVLSGRPTAYRQTEFKVDLTAKYVNGFDPDEVALDLVAVAPGGKSSKIPGFLYRSFMREIGKGVMSIPYASTEALKRGSGKQKSFEHGELLKPTGPAEWRVRFTPTEVGTYQLTFVLREKNGVARKSLGVFKVSKGQMSLGFVGIDPQNPRGFRLSTGQPYFPIGANVGWAGERGTRDYDDWLPEYGKVGANWGRVWLSPSWATFGLEQPGSSGKFDLANAWRLDYVLDLAARKGIRLDLCIDSYNVLKQDTSWPEWERSPFNRVNGGPLARPIDFWTDPVMARLYRNKLRYLVARWGSDPSVFSWEFWNEVDGVSDYKAGPVKNWHRQMAEYLRSIDPYRHLISTSYGGNGEGAGDASVFALPGIDFAVSHLYDAPDGPVAVVADQRRLRTLKKPHFVAEFGADASGPRAQEDPKGMQLHDALWASIASGASGGSMLWWWDSYVHPKKLYPLLGSAASFMKGIDWGREQLEEAPVRLEYRDAPTDIPLRDLLLEGGPATWSPSEFNRARTLSVDADGVHGKPVAGFQHGLTNHADLHNPVTFETNLPWSTVLDVIVGDVSGYGGASLRVTVDGRQVIDEMFAAPARRSDTLKQYAGTRKINLGSGRHRIVVENLGQDWVKVDYRFENAVRRTAPPLIAWASTGPNLGIAWVRLEDRSWRRVIEQKKTIAPSPPAVLRLPNLRPGIWKVVLWDTWAGRALSVRRIHVNAKSPVRLELLSIASDVAVKLTRVR